METNIISFNDSKQSTALSLPEEIYSTEYKEGLIHQVVTAILASKRQGSKAQKTRSEVSGGGAKPWRQKGTGRARAGTIRSPIWRKGGVTFAAKPRSFTQKVNKKAYKLALRSVVAELTRQGRLLFCSDVSLDAPKTKHLLTKLQAHNVENDCLIVVKELDTNLLLAARNLINVDVVTVNDINPYNLIAYKNVLVADDSIEQLNGMLLP